jgi:hypothetical protein
MRYTSRATVPSSTGAWAIPDCAGTPGTAALSGVSRQRWYGVALTTHQGITMPRGRKTLLTIHLTADERQTLLAWQRSAKSPARQARRGRILLLLAEGMTVTEVAQRVGVTRRSVAMWAQRFMKHGLEGLADKPRRGCRPRQRQPDRT